MGSSTGGGGEAMGGFGFGIRIGIGGDNDVDDDAMDLIQLFTVNYFLRFDG
jgi:hypothetical protein